MTRMQFSKLESSTVPISIADPGQEDMPLVYVNSAFEGLTGYSRSQILGKNCRFLQSREDYSAEMDKIRYALENERSCTACLTNMKASGELFDNYLFLAPYRDAMAKLYFMGCQYEFKHSSTLKDMNVHFDLLNTLTSETLEVRNQAARSVLESMKVRSVSAFLKIKRELEKQRKRAMT